MLYLALHWTGTLCSCIRYYKATYMPPIVHTYTHTHTYMYAYSFYGQADRHKHNNLQHLHKRSSHITLVQANQIPETIYTSLLC